MWGESWGSQRESDNSATTLLAKVERVEKSRRRQSGDAEAKSTELKRYVGKTVEKTRCMGDS